MANQVNVNTTNNQVTVTQGATQIVTVSAQGPQGVQGPVGATGPSGSIPNTGSFATTGSNSFIGNQIITGSLIISGSSTFTNIGPASFSGSTSITGSLNVTGSIVISGSGQVITSLDTGSFVTNSDTGSFITNSQTGSFATTGSNSFTGSLDVSGSLIVTGSILISGSGDIITSDDTGSFVTNSDTGSFITNSQTGSFITNSDTGSFITNSQTGSFATTGSNSFTGSLDVSGSLTITGSLTVSGSGTFTNIGPFNQTGESSFIGNITSSGNISASGDINANNIIASNDLTVSSSIKLGNGITVLTSDNIALFQNQLKIGTDGSITEIEIGRSTSSNRKIEIYGQITASGAISASGDIIGATFGDSDGNIVFTGNVSGSGTNSSYFGGEYNAHGGDANSGFTLLSLGDKPSISAIGTSIQIGNATNSTQTGISLVGEVTASSNISASGDIVANKVTADVVDTSFETFLNFEAATAFTFIAPFPLTINFTGSSTSSMDVAGFVTASANTSTFSVQQTPPITLNIFDKLKVTPSSSGLFSFSGSRTI